MSFENCGSEILLNAVQVTSEFWVNRMEATRTGALPAIYDQMKKTGRWDCLKLKWKPGNPQKPHRFWGSDVAKWLEAACYSLIRHPDSVLAALVEEAVDMIRGAQWKDGYLNTYYSVVEPGKRWTNLAWSHEMYDAGHFLEAALAHYMYSGSMRLLKPILNYIKYIHATFGPNRGQKHGYPGHQELELAILKTYEHFINQPGLESLGLSDLLDLAKYFIEERGTVRSEGHYFDVEAKARGDDDMVPPEPLPYGEPRFSYYQADEKVRDMRSVNGHSVRAMYWLTAVAHLSRLDKDESLLEAAEKLWDSTTKRKMYITGGLGAVGQWEGFGPDYFLPNETGYVETCAAIGLVLFAHQMLLINPRKAEYAAVMERALYNGVIVGMSLDGKSFFYENPLATIGKVYQRSSWFEVSCCPPNVARLLGSLGKYIYSVTADDTIHVHLYIPSSFETVLSTGRYIRLTQTGNGPWQGGAKIAVEGDGRSDVKIDLRIPEGVEGFEVSLQKAPIRHGVAGNLYHLPYMESASTFTELNVDFTYRSRRVLPHPLDVSNHGHVAFARGPFIYGAETVDNPIVSDLRAIRIPDDAAVIEVVEQDAFAPWGLKDVVTLKVNGVALAEKDGDETGQQVEVELQVKLVPVALWANRGRSDLRIWLPRRF